MRLLHLNVHAMQQPRKLRRAVLAPGLIVVAAGLGACGGAGVTTLGKQDFPPSKVSKPSTLPLTTAPARKGRATPARSSPKSKPPANGTFYAPAAASYHGAAPLRCLRNNGLTQARHAVENNVWEGALSQADMADPNKRVFVDGPYRSPAKASASAHSLGGIEYSAPGGVWVVSAALPSRLRNAVEVVAACLAQSG